MGDTAIQRFIDTEIQIQIHGLFFDQIHRYKIAMKGTDTEIQLAKIQQKYSKDTDEKRKNTT